MNAGTEERGRGWYSPNSSLIWFSGEPHRLSPSEEEAFYYCTPDDFIDWIEEPKHYDWGDTYNVDEDEKDEDGLLAAENQLTYRG